MLVMSLATVFIAIGLSSTGLAMINGTSAFNAQFAEVVPIVARRGLCTGTIVGPNVVLTAAHCASNNYAASVVHSGEKYPVRFYVSRDYDDLGHDLALAVANQPFKRARFATIGGRIGKKDPIVLLGYGCDKRGGKGGKLRLGHSLVRRLSPVSFTSRLETGGAVCFGDSGGPAFTRIDGQRYLIGVNSAGNIKDTNYNIRLDTPVSLGFLRRASRVAKVDLCGITTRCQSDGEPLAGR